jgi:integrase
MPVKPNDLAIRNLRRKAIDYEVAVLGHRGLTVRVHPSGERTYRLRYRQDGVLKRLALDATTFEDARKEWREQRDKIKVGEDPAAATKAKRAAKALQRQAERAAATVAELGEDFIERYAKRKKRTWRADEVMLQNAVNPILGPVLARDIQRRDVLALVDKIAARAPIYANRVLAVLRKMYAWAVEQEIVASSPCFGVKPPGTAKHRDRVLTDHELRALWNAPASAMERDLHSAIKLQLLTGQRIGEVIGSRWREFDLKKREWTIPGDRTKNRRPNLVPLTDGALAVLHQLSQGGEFLFERRGKKVSHLRVDVAGHELGEAISTLQLEPFGSHDLRRSVATRLAELRVPRIVIDSLLNHVDRTVGAVYDRYSYQVEKRSALDAWAGRLSQVVDARKSTVTPIRRVDSRKNR